MDDTFDPTVVFQVVDLGGVLANGILGGVLARRLNFDPVGFVVLAIISGLGGGMLRDTLLQAGPPVALTNPAYLGAALIGALIAFLVDVQGRFTHRSLLLADALALGCWSATGTAKAFGLGLPWLSAIFLGIITAVGGGMIRDLVVREVPAIFFPGPLNATVSLLASCFMAVALTLDQPQFGMAGAILIATVMALAARRWKWTLPVATDLRERIPHRRARRDSTHED